MLRVNINMSSAALQTALAPQKGSQSGTQPNMNANALQNVRLFIQISHHSEKTVNATVLEDSP